MLHWLLCLFAVSAHAEVTPGLARTELYVPALAGKRVGLVVNQASVFKGTHTIEFLRGKGVNLVKLYALEHGVRGQGGAGETIPDGVDPQSGLPIVSLYGDRKKPDAAALAGVDAVVFDVQDVGVRFFTYISSLGLILEACAEHSLPVVVLDRPNPNGDYVDGPVLSPGLHSFVGAYPIPVVYGLSIGELARMIVGEGWQHTAGIHLTVVSMDGWSRAVPVAPEVRPSPGLKTLAAIRAYPSLCFFEPTRVSVGRGTDHPFEMYGMPSPALGPFAFTPVGDSSIPYVGKECHGTEFFSRSPQDIPRFTTDLFASAVRAAGSIVTDRHFLELLVGDRAVVDAMVAGKSWAEIRPSVAPAIRAFETRRSKYLLYP
jgi:uncharacterized protein YbbC (DUF1343 family)